MLFEADLHTHTVASGHAYSTIKEMAAAAEAKGLKLIAVTDHGLKMPDGPHEYYFSNLSALPRKIGNIEILRGVEANIIDTDGNLDMPERLLKELDIVLAGFHYATGLDGYSQEDYTRAVLGALANPLVHIIVHPGNPQFPVDIEKLVRAATRENKALEINNNSFHANRHGSLPHCQYLARLAKKYNTWITINSDAHIFSSVGDFKKAWDVACGAGIERNQVLNLTADRVKKFLKWHEDAAKKKRTCNGITSQRTQGSV